MKLYVVFAALLAGVLVNEIKGEKKSYLTSLYPKI